MCFCLNPECALLKCLKMLSTTIFCIICSNPDIFIINNVNFLCLVVRILFFKKKIMDVLSQWLGANKREEVGKRPSESTVMGLYCL